MSGESFLHYQSFWIIVENVFKVFIEYTIDFISIFIQDDWHHNAHCSSWADKPAANQGTAFTTTCRQDHLLDFYILPTWQHVTRISFRASDGQSYHPESATGIILSPTTAYSAVQDLEQELTITDIATCYLDPEPELDMTERNLDRHGIHWSSWFGGNHDSEPKKVYQPKNLECAKLASRGMDSRRGGTASQYVSHRTLFGCRKHTCKDVETKQLRVTLLCSGRVYQC